LLNTDNCSDLCVKFLDGYVDTLAELRGDCLGTILVGGKLFISQSFSGCLPDVAVQAGMD